MNIHRSLLLLGAIVTCASATRAAETAGPQTNRLPGWYQWRGPEQTGVSREKNLPDKWSPPDNDNPKGENVLWTAPIGGMSSPIVFNNRLYTYTRDAEVPSGPESSRTLAPGPETQEAFVCLDARDGHLIWKHTDPMFQTDLPFHRLGWSNPVGDPLTGRVYGMGAQCDLVCLDGQSGKLIWQHHMTEEYGVISTFGGRTPSPAIDENELFIGGVSFGWGDHARAQYRLFCFDKNTGELRWTSGTGGLPVDAPYNTPVITVINGQRLIILAAGDGGIHAFQARTGKKVWSFKASVRGMNDSVVVDGDYIYCGHDLDNPDTSELGRIYCLDAGHLEPGKPGAFGPGSVPAPKEVWRFTGKPAGSGISTGFPSPVIVGDRLYFEDDAATVWALDKKTGKLAWSKKCGTTGKASLTWGDGKLYVGEANGRFWVLKDAGTKAEVLSKAEVPDKFGREYAIFGSVAIDQGRIFLETANKMYCIGKADHKTAFDPIPPFPTEQPAEKGAAPALVQVVPADAALRPNEKLRFTARLFDDKGRLLGTAAADQVKWSIGQLTMPPAPPRPKVIPPPSGLQGKSASVDELRQQIRTTADALRQKYESNYWPRVFMVNGQPTNAAQVQAQFNRDLKPQFDRLHELEQQLKTAEAAENHVALAATAPIVPPEQSAKAGGPTTAPTTGPSAPTKVGNLKGEIGADGTFTAAAGPPQGGAILATVGKIKGEARVRVLPPLPWKIDFESTPIGVPPLTWIGAGGKFAVEAEPGNADNKVLQKLLNFDLYYRARTYAGTPDMADYTMQADVKVNEKIAGDGLHEIPDAGIINSRYVLNLLGNDQKLQVVAWIGGVPDARQPSGSLNSTISFPWKAKTWYRLKLVVHPRTVNGAPIVHVAGKAWPTSDPEPQAWQVQMDDKLPNTSGSPGLFGNSLVGEQKSEIFYDNILVTPNESVESSNK